MNGKPGWEGHTFYVNAERLDELAQAMMVASMGIMDAEGKTVGRMPEPLEHQVARARAAALAFLSASWGGAKIETTTDVVWHERAMPPRPDLADPDITWVGLRKPRPE